MHTPEQIEKWAREAKLAPIGIYMSDGRPAYAPELTLFAALVAQHEREDAAQICDFHAKAYGMQSEAEGDRPHGKMVAANTCAAAIRNSDGG